MSGLADVRKVFEGVATRHEMYSLFNRHSQAPFDDDRSSGRHYAGEWFEVTEADYERMLDLLPPLFQNSDIFAMREFLAASVTSVFFSLPIDGRRRFFHGYCDLANKEMITVLRGAIIDRESRPVRAMSRAEKLEHIWSTAGSDFRAYADLRFPPNLRKRRIVLVFPAAQGKVWKLLDNLSNDEIAAKLPVQFRSLSEPVAA
jgi:hypothetical protein